MHAGNNSKRVLVAKNINRTSGLTSANMHDKLKAGEIIILDEKGTLISTAVAAKAALGIIIYQGTSNGIINSGLIKSKDIKSYLSFKFMQTSEKKAAFGYNGTTGSIEVIDSNNYQITVEHKGESSHSNANPFIHTVGYTSPSANTNQYIVAKGLADVAVLNYSQFDNAPLAYVITSSSGVGNLTGCTVTDKSKVVSYIAGTPVVGSALIIPGLAGTPYGDEPDTVYEIVVVDTVNKIVTLDREYQHSGQSGIAINSIANVAVDNYGFVIEGTLNSFKIGFGSYIKDNFYFEAKESGSTTITKSGTGFDIVFGNGRHESVSIDEFNYQGYEGRNINNEYQFQNAVNETISGNGYSSINIVYETGTKINTLESNGQPKQVVIYLDRGNYQDIADNAAVTSYGTNIINSTGADTVNGDSIINVLNAFMVGAGIINTGLNVAANSGLSLAGAGTFNSGIDV